MNSGIKVIAPASVSNLACGFDVLGMCLDLPCDEIVGRLVDEPGIHLAPITGHKKNIPLNPELNVASVAAKALMKEADALEKGVELKIHKHIPAGSGLGSSAASAVASVVLVNELLGHPFEKRDLIPFAIEGEMIASITKVGDNVVSCMLGGLNLIRDIETNDFHRIYTPPGLFMAILLPDITIATHESRRQLNPDVSLDTMIRQSANLGSFIIGMHQGDFDLIRRSMVDLVIEPQRKHLVPHFELLQEIALSMGALGCSISGSGPAVFALCQEKLQATNISASMLKIYELNQLDARTFVCGINHDGAVRK